MLEFIVYILGFASIALFLKFMWQDLEPIKK